MDRLQSMEVFVKVVECGSFTRAAAALSMSTPMVSTHISQLENRLGVRLLNRTTRQMDLTQDGEVYYRNCRTILGDIADAEASLSAAKSHPHGRLRVDVSMTDCEILIVPILPEFHRRYPDIKLEIVISNHAVEVGDAPSDVIIRHSMGEGASMIARPLASARLLTVASPDYLARFGEPQSPEDLQHHECIGAIDANTGRINNWIFAENGASIGSPMTGSVAFSHGGPRKHLVMLGFGIAQMFSFQIAKELDSGQLKRVLIPWEVDNMPLSVLYQKNQHLSAKQRAFIDFILEIYPPGTELKPPVFLEMEDAKLRPRKASAAG